MNNIDLGIEKQLKTIDKKVSNLYHSDYTYVKNNLRSMIWYNFLIGLSRGLGMAVGFTLLGAIVIYFLQKIVLLHLPGVSQLISDIIKFIEMYNKN